jgi:hypothetical protein
MKIDQATKSLIGLALSSVLGSPSCWQWHESNHDDTWDMGIGSGNNFWLRTAEDGSLYVQCRDNRCEHYAKQAVEMILLARDIRELTGIEIKFQCSFDEYCVTAGMRKEGK